MNRTLRAGAVLRLVALCLFSWLAMHAGEASAQRTFTEDFTTTTWKDNLYTNADWDTSAGQIQLTPFVPSTLSTISLASPANVVVVRNRLIFIGTAGSGLQIYDVNDPAAPVFVGSYTATTDIVDLDFSGDILIACTGTGDALTLNVSDPSTPALNATVPIGGTTLGVDSEGMSVFLAAGASGLVVFDIATGTTGALLAAANVQDVLVSGDTAFLALANGSVEAVDVSTPLAPAFVSSVSVGGSAEDLALKGDDLFVAAGSAGLQVVDITQPTTMSVKSSVALTGTSVDVKVVSDIAFVASRTGGVHQIDISDSAVPAETTVHTGGGSAESADTDLDVLYVAEGASGVVIHNWALNTGIRELSSYTPVSADLPTDIEVRGDWLYLLNGQDLEVVDISDPMNPVFKRTVSISGTPTSMDADGDYLYIVSLGATTQLEVYSLQNPSLPLLVTALSGAWPVEDLLVVENRIYIVGSRSFEARMVIIDISDPLSPVAVSDNAYPAFSAFHGIAVDGDLAYVTTSATEVEVFDVNDAALPVLQSTIPTSTSALQEIVISGGYAYCAGGLSVLDLATGTEVLFNPLNSSGYDRIAKVGNHVYLGGILLLADVRMLTPTTINSWSNIYSREGSGLFAEATRLYTIGRSQRTLYISDLVNPYWNPNAVKAASIPFDNENEVIAAFQLQSTGSGTGLIHVSSNGLSEVGDYFTNTVGYEFIPNPGSDLVWNAILPANTRFDATISSITIDWLIQAPEILSITDVPGDQGGWARLKFTASGYDRLDTGTWAPISGYNVHRRIDNAAFAEKVLAEGEPVLSPMDEDDVAGRSRELGSLIRYQDRVFLRPAVSAARSAEPGLQAAAPGGLWEVVASVFATQSADYTALVPTLADSNGTAVPSVYFVSAHSTTPSEFYESAADSGFSVDNVAPGVPAGFMVNYGASGNALDWIASTELDFQFYRVYRGSDPAFVADATSLVQETGSVGWTDTAVDPFSWFYKISAVDDAGNESAAVSPFTVTDAPSARAPRVLALRRNTPNPFNPRTRIGFDLPKEGHARLVIFNLAGREVKVLMDEDLPAGTYGRTWDGTDDAGRAVGSGTYVYRLETVGGVRTRKMSLVR